MRRIFTRNSNAPAIQEAFSAENFIENRCRLRLKELEETNERIKKLMDNYQKADLPSQKLIFKKHIMMALKRKKVIQTFLDLNNCEKFNIEQLTYAEDPQTDTVSTINRLSTRISHERSDLKGLLITGKETYDVNAMLPEVNKIADLIAGLEPMNDDDPSLALEFQALAEQYDSIVVDLSNIAEQINGSS